MRKMKIVRNDFKEKLEIRGVSEKRIRTAQLHYLRKVEFS
jgi:hypothetical protein